MRIIAGKHKGRAIELGKGCAHVRPSSGFMRESVFNILSHGRYGGVLDGARVADLCCGSGALGLEALSRGAASVTFVDMDHHSLQAAMQNARRFGEEGNVKAVQANVTALPAVREAFDVLFVDPPYHGGLVAPCLKSLLEGGWVNAESLIVAEHDEKETVEPPPGFMQEDQRRYGRAMVRLLRVSTPGS